MTRTYDSGIAGGARTPEPWFRDFLLASELSEATISEFGVRIVGFVDVPEAMHPFTQPGREIELPPVRDRLQRLFGRRRSERSFSNRPLSHRQVTAILAATGSAGGRRVVPSAGSLNPIHTYGFAHNTDGPLGGQIIRFIPDEHRVGLIGPVLPVDKLRSLFSLECEGTPQLLLVFVADPRATTAKYGERGGRFLLQEVGHAAQNVGLRLAHDGLKGYILGGLLDISMKRALGLAGTPAVILGGYACGR